MDKRTVSYVKFPSGRKKRIIKEQNAVISSFLHDKLEMESFQISRDKADHIVIITHYKNGKIFSALLLGSDEKGKPTLLIAGKLFYAKDSDQDVYVQLLRVVNDYKSSGIGTVLLKAFENYAVEEGYSQITLRSLLSASKLKSVYKPDTENKTGEGLKYLTYPTGKLKQKYSGYFDRNLYFYFSNGFEQIEDPSLANADCDNIPLVKRNLHKTDIQYGVRGKKYLFRPTDPRFRISTMHIDLEYLHEESVHFEGKAVEKAFVPFKCLADEEALAALEKFLASEASGYQKN